MIEKVSIRNFKCLRNVDVSLNAFTVLIGKNDTGKSSFLEATSSGLAPVASADGQLQITKSATAGKSPAQTTVTLHFKDGSKRLVDGHNTTGVSEGDEAAWFHLSELFRDKHQWWGRPYRLDVNNLRQSMAVGGGTSFEQRPLRPDGRGLVVVLDRIAGEHDEVKDRIEKELKDRLPSIANLRIRPAPSGQVGKIVGFDLKDGSRITAEQASDGVMLVLAYLTIANDEYCPKILMIEEPENGIHPKQLREVLRLLYSLTTKPNPCQVILTTHSPYVLDFVPPEAVRVFRRQEDNSVEVVPFAEMQPIKDMLAEGYTPGEAWFNSEEDELHEDKKKHARSRAK